MRPARAAIPIALVLFAAFLGWLLLRGGGGAASVDELAYEDAPGAGPPSLRGAGGTEPGETPAPAAGNAEAEELGADAGESVTHVIDVLDYRAAGVPGVEVFHEVDVWDASTGGPGEKWKTLAHGTTDASGRVRLALDRTRRRLPGEGLNHRLRVVPPKEREDLAPTWRIWRPSPAETYYLVQTHVVVGRVVDASGEPVWAATVWLGRLSTFGYVVTNPDWRKTTTDVDGHFRFAGIPTTSDWLIDVWAVGPGEAKPKSSRSIRNAQSVALDSRQVQIRLE